MTHGDLLRNILDSKAPEPPPVAEPLRLLFWDIETAPLLAHVWGAKTDYIGAHQFAHDTFVLSWAAKWSDGKKVYSQVLTSEEARAQDDSRIVAGLADMLRQADIVVAHNGDRFDVPMLNNRLLLLRQEPLGPVRTIDTLKLARKTLRLASNKLDYLAQQLGVGQKLKTGFDLWLACYHGDAKSLKKMARYNRKDVTVLEDVYRALVPYVRGLPRLVESDGVPWACPTCGSDNLTRDGHYRTNASTFARYRCDDCKRHCRSRRADKAKKLDLHPL